MRLLDLKVALSKAFFLAAERRTVGIDRYREHRLIELCEEIGEALDRPSHAVWTEIVEKGRSDAYLPLAEAGW